MAIYGRISVMLVMGKFRKGTINYSAATDVAARGIDVDDVEAVFNYDVPQDEKESLRSPYRPYQEGPGVRVVHFPSSGKDFYKLRDIQRYAKIEIKKKEAWHDSQFLPISSKAKQRW